MDCTIWFHARCANESVVNTGQCTVSDEGCTLLTKDIVRSEDLEFK
jgi:hypothetical protein